MKKGTRAPILIIAAIAVVLLSFGQMATAAPILVKDINTQAAGSSPSGMIDAGGTLFFAANDGTHGWELYTSNGTTASTTLAKDINPGLASSSPGQLVQLGGKVYFTADDGIQGSELWSSNGTDAGTTLVLDINPGPAASNIQYLTTVGSALFFWADDGTNGLELWTSDGTAGGTHLLKDMNLYSLSPFYDLNGKAIYAANDGYVSYGTEPIVSDGTSVGTFRIADVTPGYNDGFHGSEFGILGNYAYFMGGTMDAGSQNLYRTDGTPGNYSYFNSVRIPAKFVTVVSELFFVGQEYGTSLYSVWKTNGLTVTKLATPSTSAYWNSFYPPTSLTNVNGTLYFSAPDSTVDPVYPTNYYLWKSDGSSAGTTTVSTRVTNPSSMTAYNGLVYFTGYDAVNGWSLWSTDGTDANTARVAFTAATYPYYLTVSGGILYYAAYDMVNGSELWRSDGTVGGTYALKINTVSTASTNVTCPAVAVNGVYYFCADGGVTGAELWKSDGTAGGTMMVKDIGPGAASADVSSLTVVNNTLFFVANETIHGYELWKSDGTETGTTLVKDIVPGAGSSYPSNLVNSNGTLFFTADDGTNGNELWKSDGTDAGTVMVKDLYPGAYNGSNPAYLTKVNGTLFFTADDGANGNELWRSDGTDAGTVMVKDIYPGEMYYSSSPSYLTNVNGTLYFSAYDDVNGTELWKSDGTAAGTVMVKDVNPGIFGANSYPESLTNINGLLYFVADDGTNGYQLWKSNGTDAGTILITTINPAAFHPSQLTWVNGSLFFTADDGTHGVELWKSDGTTAGTVQVKDLFPGLYDSSPSLLTNVNGMLYFAADDGMHGNELWQSDGTDGGTAMVQDLFPGAAGSWPNTLFNVQGALFFFADDGEHGNELMTYQLANATPPTVVTTTPRPGTTGASPTTDIAAVFSEAMDPATINASTFTVGGVTGTVTYDGVNTATFVPFSALAYGATYTVTVTTGAQDVSGMPLSTDVTWTFSTYNPALTITKKGAGTGTVTSDLGGISCGATCSAVYSPGDIVTLTAAPDGGWMFLGWSGACTGTGPCVVTMSENRVVAATFANPNVALFETFDTGMLPVGWQDQNSDWIFNYSGNNTGGSGGYAYTNAWNGELRTPTLDLSAMTAPFLEFKTDYLGDGYNPNATIELSVNGGQSWTNVWNPGATVYPGPRTISVDLTAVASGQSNVIIRFLFVNYDSGSPSWAIDDVRVFEQVISTNALLLTASSGGSVTSTPQGINACAHDTGVCNSTFITGSSVQLFAVPDPGYIFGGWSGDCAGAENPYYVTMDAAKACSVTFTTDTVLPAIGMDITQTYKTQWGTSGSGDGQLSGPRGIARDGSGNVYVADWGNNRIQKFSPAGAYLTQWGTTGSGDGQFNRPYGLAVDSSGNVYVSDMNNNRIQKFNASGVFLTKWGTAGSGDGLFSGPRGVAVDSSGNVYVADLNNNRIQKFNASGDYLMQWGTPGSDDGQFSAATNIAVDSLDYVYVSDTYNSRIQKFSSNGMYLAQFGANGSGVGQLWNALGVSVDGKGNVYVSDTYNNRIQKFGPDGTYLTQWGMSGTAEGQFSSPNGITVDAAFNVYVADLGNNRIQKFVPWAATSTTPNGSYGQGSQINISISFTKPVSSADLTITLSSGASLNASFSDQESWSGVYTVGAGESTPALTVASVRGTITDAFGNSATDPFVPVGLNIADNKAIMITSLAGLLDTSFHSSGTATFNNIFANGNDSGNAVAAQPDGKVVVVGSSMNSNANSDILILRYNSDGTLDNTFGSNGVVYYDAAYDDYGNGVALQPDGKIVVVGSTGNGTTQDLLIARYTAAGALDSSFGTNGVTSYHGSATGSAEGVKLQPDGKIVVVGGTGGITSNYPELLLCRYNTDGTPDTSFGANGVVTYTAGNAGCNWGAYGNGVALQTDGTIVITGYERCDSTQGLVARFTHDGSLDTNFGESGVAWLNADSGNSVVIQSDGNILVAVDQYGYNAAISRLTSTGVLDNSFEVSYNSNPGNPYSYAAAARSVSLQPDGKIVAVGSDIHYPTYSHSSAWIARFNSDGSFDTSFNSTGMFLYDGPANGNDVANAIALQPDGKIVAVGSSSNGSNSDVLILRFTSGLATPPAVASTIPAQGATGVQTMAAAISATFSIPMDPTTFDNTSFLVSGPSGTISGTVVYNNGTATFTPSAALDPTANYWAMITTKAKDQANGLSLPANYAWTFTTETLVTPTVISVAPVVNATDVPVSSQIAVTFSTDMNPATIDATTSFLVSGATGSVTYNVGTRTATFTPSSLLQSVTTYTATITTAVTSSLGIALGADYTWSFTTLLTTHTITATVGAHGSITPAGSIVVSSGTSTTFTIVPSAGYSVQTVTVDMVSQGTVTAYTFTDVIADHTISASFADLTPPTGTVTINGGVLYTNTALVGLSLTCSDAGSGCTSVEISNTSNFVSSTIWSIATGTSVPWTLAAGDGPKNVYVRFTDVDDNPSSIIGAITLDSTPPSTIASPAGGYLVSVQTVTLSCTDSLSGCMAIFYTVNGSDPLVSGVAYTSPIPLSASTTTLRYSAIDFAGNQETAKIQVYSIDPNAPSVTNLSPAAGSHVNTTDVSYSLNKNMASGSVVFTSTSGTVVTHATFTLTMPDLTTGIHTITGMTLNNGTVYTLTVSVTDNVGRNASSTNTNVTYDTTAAVITITSPVAGSRINTATLSYTLNEAIGAGDIVITDSYAQSFPYTLSNGELAAGSHTVNTNANLVDGYVYTFSIQNVVDLAGNPAAFASVANVTLDKTAVVITGTWPVTKSIITIADAGYTLSENAASGIVTFTWTGGRPDPASPHAYTMTTPDLIIGARIIAPAFDLIDGAFYAVSFSATDLVGNPATTVSNALIFYDSQYGKGPVGNVDNTGSSVNVVDDADAKKLQESYGARPGDKTWNPVCDLDHNNVIDARDLMILWSHYGQSGIQ